MSAPHWDGPRVRDDDRTSWRFHVERVQQVQRGNRGTMRSKFNGVIILLVASLAAVIFGVYRTNPQDAPAPPRTGRRSSTDLVTVDQSSLITAERLVRLPITPAERSFAADALRLADQDMDLAFAQAVRSTANQTRQIPPEAKALEAQLQKAQRALETDQAQ